MRKVTLTVDFEEWRAIRAVDVSNSSWGGADLDAGGVTQRLDHGFLSPIVA